ncbi:MAG: hypothetical protein M1822_008852 [Bathelium mastoideum]|nr:MAG: hypothetical protein M1822_008852 [Bathelium mastoideum]
MSFSDGPLLDASDEVSFTSTVHAFKVDFANHIYQIHSSCLFATSGTIKISNSGVFVNSVGAIRLPLSKDDAQALIRAIQLAPSKETTQTLQDEFVKNAWDIDTSDIQSLDTETRWQSLIDDIVRTVATGLGIDTVLSNVRAELHKMLLYGKGTTLKVYTKYADVTCEAEQVRDGYQWVLMYDLIRDSDDQGLAAATLVSQTQSLTQHLTRWRNLEPQPPVLFWSLARNYTDVGLKHLKDDDYHRARNLAQCCSDHGGFYLFFANIRTYTRIPCIFEITDAAGLSIPCNPRRVLESLLLNQIYKNFIASVIILIPKDKFMWFINGNSLPITRLRGLTETLQERMRVNPSDPTSRELLDLLCRDWLSVNYEDSEEKDKRMGCIATSAVAINDTAMFNQAVQQTTAGWENTSYVTLGKLVSIRDSVLTDDEITEALGFLKERKDAIDARFLKKWIDNILFKSLRSLADAYPEDGWYLIEIILERSEDEFRQFVLYQGIKAFVNRFLYKESFVDALMKEFQIRLQLKTGLQKPYLDDLGDHIVDHTVWRLNHREMKELQNQLQQKHVLKRLFNDLFDLILDPVVSGFNLVQWMNSFSSREVPSELVKEFYESIPPDRNSMCSELSRKIQKQAFTLPPELMEQMMAAKKNSQHDLILSLSSTYITQWVGSEPEKPKDWSRPWGDHKSKNKTYVGGTKSMRNGKDIATKQSRPFDAFLKTNFEKFYVINTIKLWVYAG